MWHLVATILMISWKSTYQISCSLNSRPIKAKWSTRICGAVFKKPLVTGLFVLICVINVGRTLLFVQLQSLVVISTHAIRQSVDISVTVCLSNFALWFMGVLGMESPILGNFAPQKPKIRRIGARQQVLPIDASPLLTARSQSWRGLASIGNTCPRGYVWIYGRPSKDERICLFVILCVCKLYGHGFLRR